MKKNTIKAFTLVEMLIVIVIIGILIAALMPRMQAAQGRARDVSRKTALSQIQSAIVTAQGDKGRWPGVNEGGTGAAISGTAISAISGDLIAAGMNGIPVDPLKSNGWSGLDSFTGTTAGDYGYIVTSRNGSKNGGFVLMAKTEVAGGSNRVVCPGATDLSGGIIKNTTDLSSINICQAVEKSGGCLSNTNTCLFSGDDQLRYIVIY